MTSKRRYASMLRSGMSAYQRLKNGWRMLPVPVKSALLGGAKKAYKYVTSPKTPPRSGPAPPNVNTKYYNKAYRHSYARFGRNKGGQYRGRIRAKKRTRRASKYYKKGAVFKKERGGVLSTSIAHTGYLGHSIAPNVCSAQVWRAVIKDLFNKAGIEFGSFDDLIARRLNLASVPNAIQFVASYKNTQDDTSVASTSSLVLQIITTGSPTAGATFEHFASLIDTQIRNDVPSSYINDESFRFINFTLLGISDYPTGAVKDVMSNLNAEDLYIDVKVNSRLTIQNRTNNADNLPNTDSTSNNPIIGKMYQQSSRWANGFEMKISPLEADTNSKPLIGDNDSGLIVASSDSAFTSHHLPASFQKPPPGWLIGATKTQKVVMQPGTIKTMAFTWRGKMMFNTYMRKLYDFFTATTTGKQPCHLGFAQLLGVECMLYDRVESTNLQLAYEINQTYNTTLIRKKIKTVPKIDVV